jgi:hypothetical protein
MTTTGSTIESVDLEKGDVSCCNNGANPAGTIDARSRRRVSGELALYQARLTALRLHGGQVTRSRHLHLLNEAGRCPTSLQEAQATALSLGGRPR